MPIKVAFVITTGRKREEGGLVQIVVFFIFVVLVGVGILSLGYGLSLFEERTISRRCWIPYERYRRRKIRRQRIRCRFEA